MTNLIFLFLEWAFNEVLTDGQDLKKKTFSDETLAIYILVTG